MRARIWPMGVRSSASPFSLSVRQLRRSLSEAPYLDHVIACTDNAGSSTWLSNTGFFVWTLASGSPVVEETHRTYRVASFRRFVGYALLSPGTEIVVKAPPSQVSWSLHGGLSATWQTHDAAADLLEVRSKKALRELKHLRYLALATSARAAYDAFGDNEDLGSDPVKKIIAALGVELSTVLP